MQFKVILVVVRMASFLSESYKTFQGSKEICIMIERYQSRNFFDSPENLGHSAMESCLVSASAVDSLEKDSSIMSIICDWKSFLHGVKMFEVVFGIPIPNILTGWVFWLGIFELGEPGDTCWTTWADNGADKFTVELKKTKDCYSTSVRILLYATLDRSHYLALGTRIFLIKE